MTYQHLDSDGQAIPLPVGKVLCVGRNYHDHIVEMASNVTHAPMFFMKPASALQTLADRVAIPTHLGACHNEIEVAWLVKKPINRHSKDVDMDALWGATVALDLTLRDIQAQCKKKGHPWERAKAFDGSCATSGFVPQAQINADDIAFSLWVNGEPRQVGNTKDMIFSIETLLKDASQVFSLLPGDIILTGTPSGVGPLHNGDELKFAMGTHLSGQCKVMSW